MQSKTNIFTWVKDLSLKYIGFSENFFTLAGAYSPNAILGKDYYFCIWKEKIWFPIPFYNQCLTLKEFNVLKLVILGKTAKLIAKELAICPRTVEEHIYHIKYKLRCRYKHEIPSLVIEYDILQSMVLEPC